MAWSALISTAEQIRQVIDQAPIGMVIARLDGTIVQANPAFAKMLDYAADELLGLNALTITHPEDRPAEAERLRKLATGVAQDYRIEKRYLAKTGRAVWARLHGHSVTGTDGPEFYFAQIQDITVEKQSQEAKAELENRFLVLAESLPDVVYHYIVADGSIAYINPAGARFTGYAPEDFYSDPSLIYRIVHPEDLPRLVKLLESRGLSPEPIVLRWLHKNGQVLWFEAHSRPVRNSAGQVISYVGTARDVTDAKQQDALRTEQISRLETERAWFESIVRHIPAGVVIAEAAPPHRLWFSDHARDYYERAGFRIEPEKGIAQFTNILRRPGGACLTPAELPLAHALSGETLEGVEFCMGCSTDAPGHILLSAGPVIGANGDIVAAIAAWEDVSIYKEMERLRDEWSAVVAHDLRQPIQSITLFSGLMEHRLEDPALRSNLDIMKTSVMHLTRMVNDLLSVPQLQANRLELNRDTVDVADMIEDVLARNVWVTQDRQLRTDTQPGLSVYADSGRFEQVLVNLLSNAVKFGDPAKPIEIQAYEDGGEAVVAVRNSGPGMTPEEVSALFQRFHRAASTRYRAAGLGLGLYIARGIVEAHGGSIGVDTSPEGPTTFKIRLPVTR